MPSYDCVRRSSPHIRNLGMNAKIFIAKALYDHNTKDLKENIRFILHIVLIDIIF